MAALERRLEQEMVATWRDLHEWPELAFQEERTAGLVADRLRRFGLPVREGVAGTGVVATLEGSGPGPNLFLRAELDALPVDEDTGLPFASRRPGVMHACGHDAHTAILLAVAEALAGQRDRFAGTVQFVFQPAEEVGRGAQEMIDAGVMAAPPDAVVALHMHAHLPVGTIGVADGVACASAGEFEIEVEGRGGHAAFPHTIVDPVLASAYIISALQALVPREVSALERAVLTTSTMNAGTAFNVVPDSVALRGTIRAGSQSVHQHLADRAVEMAARIAEAWRCRAAFTHRLLCPVVRNDPAVSAVVREAAAAVVPPHHVLSCDPVMASDDLAFFLQRVPGCYFFVGIAPTDGRAEAPHHSAQFTVDERSVRLGAQVMLGAAQRFLSLAEW